jgi:EAL domain-containing protein (putative c-di-GMP-specific phosphodiesterase class I)
MASWHRKFKHLQIAINLSARQFQQDNLTTHILDTLNNTGLDENYLEFEITESVLLTDVERCIQILRNLKDMGVQIAIDDFGTGYSSLNYLKQFPIDILKIDRCFIEDAVHDKNDVAIIKTVLTLSKNLSMSVIAEGVETHAQCKLLSDLGCDELQGFYFSRPLNKEEFESMLRENRKLEMDDSYLDIHHG